MAVEIRLVRHVQFHETDAAGFVHFSCFFRYMEEAETALWREAGISNAPGRGIGWPRVSASFEYHSPLRFEDQFEVSLRIDAISERTIRYTCAIARGDTPIATGSLHVVCAVHADGEPLRAMPIPVAILDRLNGTAATPR